MKRQEGEVYPYSVKVPLTRSELLAYADELTDVHKTFEEHSATFDEAKATFKQKTAEFDSRSARIISLLRAKEEYRDVECFDRLDHANGIVEIARADTGETVGTRKMNPDEYSRPLPFPKLAATGTIGVEHIDGGSPLEEEI